MPRQKRPSAAAAEDYDSDDGFVEDAPKSKKAKVSKSGKAGGDGAGGVGGKVAGKDGEVFWEVSCLDEFMEGNTGCSGGEGRWLMEGILVVRQAKSWCVRVQGEHDGEYSGVL